MNEPVATERRSLLSRLDLESMPAKDDRRVMALEFKGLMIFIGKNAASNERVVGEHPHKDCIWLHAMGAKGSHVVLCHGNRAADFPDEAIQRAASIALRYSRSAARSVIFTRLENVMKLPNAAPGVFMPSNTIQIEIE